MSVMDFAKQLMNIRPSDSIMTAKFQRICGINIHYHKKSPEECHMNGTSSKSMSMTNGSTKASNGHLISNGKSHDSQNGFTNHTTNGVKHNNVSNGVEKVPLAENSVRPRHTQQSNGVSSTVQPEHTDSAHYSNGHTGKTNKTKLSPNGLEQDSSEWTVTYSVENPFLYYLFSFGASLGNEVFYVLFFSFTLWNFDNLVMRKVLIPWVTMMYLGQAAKDVIRWPRPSSPPVVRLEERYELEYGMPSTHAMVGVAIPFGMLFFMTGRYEFHYTSGVLFAIAWSILVSFSRLYLGMHSVLDIMAGIVFAFFLMGSTAPFVDVLDKFLMTSDYAIPITVTVIVVLCLNYPHLDKWSTARGDTTLTMGVFSGIYFGLWATRRMVLSNVEYYITEDVDPMPYPLSLPEADVMGVVALRQALGLIMVVILLTSIKFIVLQVFARAWGRDPNDPETKKLLRVELPYKYLSYVLSGAAATYLLPIVFLKLGIARSSFYSEVLSLE